jgi:co-chaperonin GroES (HSP10)
MRNITPIRDNVMAKMLEPVGQERNVNGIILTERNLGEESIRPRWFEVICVGPEQTDLQAGSFVLVPHGRWSRGLDVDGTLREADKLFLLDNESLMGTSDVNPLA